MLRAAITPFTRHGYQKLFLVTTAGTVGVGTACFVGPSSNSILSDNIATTKCSSPSYSGGIDTEVAITSRLPTSSFVELISSLDLNDIEHCFSLIRPTAEALLRAVRLVKTAAVIAADYHFYYLQRKHSDSLIGIAYTWVFQSRKHNGDEEHGHVQRQRELEDTIEQLESDLYRAQQQYVDSKPSVNDTHTDYHSDHPNDHTAAISKHRLSKSQQKEAMMFIARQLANVKDELYALVTDISTNNDEGIPANIHQRNANRLLQLCRMNGGVYIKVGQHLANLDLLLPDEYLKSLSSLFDDAPVSSYVDVCHVVKEELGSSPEQLFDDFSIDPFASASLAQVHTARCKATGKKLAVKVQHKGLRETSKGDLLAIATVTNIAENLFDDFNFGWICEELTPQLPKELDFTNEGGNAEMAAVHLKRTGLDCVIPTIYWELTNERVLTMEFEEGFRATDLERIDNAGISRRDVARLISSVFNAQIFDTGFVHCDPHEANVLLREHPLKKGKPQIVLVDHGLYKRLDPDFQEAYARLWKGIVMADIPDIQSACKQLGVDKMYPLLAAMLTSRPFDEVVERSQSRSLDASRAGNCGEDKAIIKGYAQRYIKEIINMLDIVPRQMLLIFKMNDCLRHVDIALGSPVNNLVVAGQYASKRVFDSECTKRLKDGGILFIVRSWLSYIQCLVRLKSYELSKGRHVNTNRKKAQTL